MKRKMVEKENNIKAYLSIVCCSFVNMLKYSWLVIKEIFKTTTCKITLTIIIGFAAFNLSFYIVDSFETYNLYVEPTRMYIKKVFFYKPQSIFRSNFDECSLLYFLKFLDRSYSYIKRADIISNKYYNRIIIYEYKSWNIGNGYIAITDEMLDMVLEKTNEFNKSFLDKL